MSGGRPVVSALPALGHVDAIVSACPGATPTYVARLAGVAPTALVRARRSHNMEPETVERLMAVRVDHVRLLPPPLVPVWAARRHVEMLMRETGLSCSALARAIGCSYQTVYNVAGRGARGQCEVTYAVHAAIMNTTVDDARGVDYWTNRVASKTRLRALQANGWSLTALGLVHGMNLLNLAHQPDDSPIQTAVARRIKAIYDSIGDQPGTSPKSSVAARSAGYHPPIFYDDDMALIEEPTSSETDAQQEAARTDLCILGQTIEGRSLAAIAAALGVPERRVSRVRREAGLRIERAFDGSYESADERVGATAAVRDAVRAIDYRTTIEALDQSGLDYVSILRSVLDDGASDAAA